MTDNDAMIIDDYLITTGTAGDSPIGKKLVRGLDPCKGDMCMDAAYLSREMCDMLNELGLTPYIWPKKNSINNAKGSYSRGHKFLTSSGRSPDLQLPVPAAS